MKKMKKLVKRNVVKKDTIELYAGSCMTDCATPCGSYVASRIDNVDRRYQVKYINYGSK